MRKHTRGKGKSRKEGPFAIYNDPRPVSLTNELKYVDTNIGFSLVLPAGSWTKFTNAAQGTTSTTRIGDRYQIVRIEMQAYFDLVNTNDFVRFIIVQTKGLFTTPPATTDLLAAATPSSHYTYNSRELYEVIFDKYFTMAAGADSAAIAMRKVIIPRIKDQKFVSGSNNPYNGQLYMLALVGGTANVNYQVNTRVWFEDSN